MMSAPTTSTLADRSGLLAGLALDDLQRSELLAHIERKERAIGTSVPEAEVRLAGLLLTTLRSEISVAMAVANARRAMQLPAVGEGVEAFARGALALAAARAQDQRRLSLYKDMLIPLLTGLATEATQLAEELQGGRP
jgi:hypothetical protein